MSTTDCGCPGEELPPGDSSGLARPTPPPPGLGGGVLLPAWWNEEASFTATCDGPGGVSVTVVRPAGTIVSTLSQADATAKATAIAKGMAYEQLECLVAEFRPQAGRVQITAHPMPHGIRRVAETPTGWWVEIAGLSAGDYYWVKLTFDNGAISEHGTSATGQAAQIEGAWPAGATRLTVIEFGSLEATMGDIAFVGFASSADPGTIQEVLLPLRTNAGAQLLGRQHQSETTFFEEIQ